MTDEEQVKVLVGYLTLLEAYDALLLERDAIEHECNDWKKEYGSAIARAEKAERALTKSKAQAALWPEWTIKAKAAGWKPPKGWKP